MSQKSLSIPKTNWNFEIKFTYLFCFIKKSNIAVHTHVSISCLALALSFTPLFNYVFFPTVYLGFLFLFQAHSIKMNTTERVFIATLKIKGCKNEEIRNQFEKKFHKRGPKQTKLFVNCWWNSRGLDLCMIGYSYKDSVSGHAWEFCRTNVTFRRHS